MSGLKNHKLKPIYLVTLPLWQLKAWINAERPLSPPDQADGELAWKDTAYTLLRDQRQGQRDQLDINLAQLYQT